LRCPTAATIVVLVVLVVVVVVVEVVGVVLVVVVVVVEVVDVVVMAPHGGAPQEALLPGALFRVMSMPLTVPVAVTGQ